MAVVEPKQIVADGEVARVIGDEDAARAGTAVSKIGAPRNGIGARVDVERERGDVLREVRAGVSERNLVRGRQPVVESQPQIVAAFGDWEEEVIARLQIRIVDRRTQRVGGERGGAERAANLADGVELTELHRIDREAEILRDRNGIGE